MTQGGWIGTGMRLVLAAAADGLWMGGMAGGAFALALVGERVLTLALG